MKRAFTLIELLVVIAIIAILAAMLMPALERARLAAKNAACAGNMHNIGLGIQMFRGDHDQRWIAGRTTWFTYGMCELQAFVMRDYTQDWKVFLCPSFDGPVTRQPGLSTPASVADNCFEPLNSTTNNPWASTRDICYFYDERNIDDNSDPGRIINADGIAMFDWNGPQPANHKDGVNVLFVDSSATWVATLSPTARREYTIAQVTYPGAWWSNPLPTAGPWIMYGYIQNPRVGEDDLTTGDVDDIYMREGTPAQWGTANPNVAMTWWGQSQGGRAALDWGLPPPDKRDAALGGGAIAPDWWGQTLPFFRGPFLASVDPGNAHTGWQWGVTPDMETQVYQ